MRPDPLLTDALYRQAFLRAGLPMALHSADRRFLHANDAMVELLGYSLEELQAMTVMDVVHPEERDTSARFAAQWLAGIGRESRLFGRIVRKDGGVVSARIRKYVLDPGGTDGALVALAVIDRIDEEHTSEYASRHDDLTGLLNRRGFREALAVSYPENLPSVLAMLDVDHLKSVNDRFGHAAGDEVIVAVARTLALALPDDGVLCRWSGDEFVAFVPRPTADDFASARGRRDVPRQAGREGCRRCAGRGTAHGAVSRGRHRPVNCGNRKLEPFVEMVRLIDAEEKPTRSGERVGHDTAGLVGRRSRGEDVRAGARGP
ncbi:hypothetical protein TSHO111613_04620 [Tsukamurella hominis]